MKKFFVGIVVCMMVLNVQAAMAATTASSPSGLTLPNVPGGTQLTAWINPLFIKIEAWRLTEADYLTALRDTAKAKLGLTTVPTTATPQPTDTQSNTPATDAANKIFAHPGDYFNYFYASALAPVFANQLMFYIVGLLLILIILRFIVRMIV